MYFIKRDFILLAATILFVLAAWTYLDLMYALGIGAGIFFGLKAITISKQSHIKKQVGEGLCAECGEKVVKGRCPSCDSANEA